MKITPIQTSFSAGEISPLMSKRSDTEGFRQGLDTMLNMRADSRGPATSRIGSEYKGSHPGNDARVVTLPITAQFFYSLVFTEFKLFIDSLFGQPPAASYTVNSSFSDGSNSWSGTSDGNASSQIIYPGDQAQMSVDNKNDRWVSTTQGINTIPVATLVKVVWDVEGDVPFTVSVGSTPHGTDVATITTSLLSGELLFTPVQPQTEMTYITIRIDSNDNTYNTNVNYLGIVDQVPAVVEFDTPYYEHELADLQAVLTPDNNTLYILHERHAPQKLIYDEALDSFTWSVVTFVNPPAAWASANYPSCGDFFEGRLFLGGARYDPSTFWASKSGQPEDFTLNTPGDATGPLDDDGLQFTIAKGGRIEWMVGFKNLVIGTAVGEHIITSQGGYISPNDINVDQQSSYGSVGVQPVQVGDQIFYVSADRRKLRAIQYEWQADNWLSRDLTFNSEHITKGLIKHLAWQQNPNNIFHCVLKNGDVAELTYERSNNIYGWGLASRQGMVLDLASSPYDGIDYLVYAAAPIVSGTINFEIEGGVVEYMDSWADGTPVTTNGVITLGGLDHLEGFVVKILVDGKFHPDKTVVSGKVTLDYSGDRAVAGLGYTRKIKMLPADFGSSIGSGSIWNKRWNKLHVTILNSAKPVINGNVPPERHAVTLMNDREPNRTEDVQVVTLGHELNPQIEITQEEPFDLTVLSIQGEIVQGITGG